VNTNIPTLEKHLASLSVEPALRSLLESVAHSCMRISQMVSRGMLGDVLGSLQSENVQGEVQKKLDVLANDQLLEDASRSGVVAALASEEMECIYPVADKKPYLLLFDPLDGSSNIDVNVSIGTIFSVLRAPEQLAQESDFLQAGRQQIAAGYAIYGPQTMLVLTLGQGVAGFTLDSDNQQWRLTHPYLAIPQDTREFAINLSNLRHWDAPMQRYVQDCLAGETGVLGKNYNMRWIASMVADVHRILMRGGIFMYPTDARASSRHGKLRLLYEANPMSMLVEQAGGAAISATIDGVQRLLEVQPHALHQRTAVILGSRNEVERVRDYHKR